jgi:DNA primase
MQTARYAARREDRVLVVEGYFDAIRILGAGLECVVAPLGTALTADQAQLLTRYTKNVYLLYDGDAAGLKATFRAGDELLRFGGTVRVVTFPEGDDPDTFVARQGLDGLERLLGGSLDVFERKMQMLERGGWFATLPKRRAALDRLLPTLRATADPLLRELYIARAAESSGIDRTVLAREVGSAAIAEPLAGRRPPPSAVGPRSPGVEPERRVSREEPRRPSAPVRGTPHERELVRAVLRTPALASVVAERLRSAGIELRDERYRHLLQALVRRGEALAADLSSGDDQGLSEEAVAAYSELAAAPEAIQDAQRTIDDTIARLRVRMLEEEAAEIDRQVGIAAGSEKDALRDRKIAIRDEIRSLGGVGARRYGVRGR